MRHPLADFSQRNSGCTFVSMSLFNLLARRPCVFQRGKLPKYVSYKRSFAPLISRPQDWRYERGGDLARFRASRAGANLSCRIGEGSTINYIMPLVATDARGYPTKLTVSLRDLAISSSFNESRFLAASGCRVRTHLPFIWMTHSSTCR